MKFILLATIIGVNATCAVSLLDIVPQDCQSTCSGWITDTNTCLGADEVQWDNGLSYHGNKIQLFRCACSSTRLDQSTSCLTCINNICSLNPPVTTDDYKSLCTNPDATMQTIKDRYKDADLTCFA